MNTSAHAQNNLVMVNELIINLIIIMNELVCWSLPGCDTTLTVGVCDWRKIIKIKLIRNKRGPRIDL